MSRRTSSLRTQLIVLVLALATPAIALQAWWGYREYQEANKEAQLRALEVAHHVRVSIEQFLATAGDVMTGVAREYQNNLEAPDSCAQVARVVTDVLPYLANTIVWGRDGVLSCFAEPVPAQWVQDTLGALEWSTLGTGLSVGEPVRVPPSGRWVLPVAVSIGGASASDGASLVGLMPLSEFADRLRGVQANDMYLVTVTTSALQVVSRSSDARAWIGQSVPPGNARAKSVGPGLRVVSSPDASGVQRAWGMATIPGVEWEIFVGVPEREVNGPALALALRRVAFTALVLLAGILFAFLTYRRISRALGGLVDATRRTGPGERVPLPSGTPTEVTAVVEQFNRTLEARDVAEAAERSALERYASIFNEAVFGIFLTTPEGRILEANPAMATMLGHAEIRPVLDTPLRAWFVDPDRHDIMLATCLSQGTLEGFMAEWVRGDGRIIVVRIDGRTARAESGTEAIEMIVDDVTEELRRDRELQQKQKMEAIGRLAGGIAHDFNNLLTVITANTDLVVEALPPESPVHADLEQVQGAAHRATTLTRQLLSFSRGDTSTVRPIDVNLLVAELEAMLRRLIGVGIVLETSLQADIPPVLADPSRLEQVVMNLVLNARDALPDGGSIHITTERRVGRSGTAGSPASVPGILISVRDNGVGMDDRTKVHVFEPFFTTKGAGRGTGLGLATVYGIVQQAGGRITLDSAVGQGSTFRIWLPASVDAEAPSTRSSAARAVQGGPA